MLYRKKGLCRAKETAQSCLTQNSRRIIEPQLQTKLWLIVIMNKIIKKIVICNFTKTISSAVLTAVAVNIIMTNATKWSLIEGLIPFALAIIIVVLIDIYEYRCEREDKINLDELEDRIEKLEGNLDER